MTRLVSIPALVLLTLAVAVPAHAQGQAFNINLGYFAVRGEDTRVADDVLLANRSFLLFDVKDFSNAAVGAEWLVAAGQHFEVSAGVGYFHRTVPTIYLDWVDADGTEVDQDLNLRIVPVTATVRFLPLGHRSAVQPYFGVGVGVLRWRYSEVGEFVDFSDATIFRARYVGEGTSMGPVVLGGIRGAADRFLVGAELRYQKAEGKLDAADFFGDRIDLGGVTVQGTFGIRF